MASISLGQQVEDRGRTLPRVNVMAIGILAAALSLGWLGVRALGGWGPLAVLLLVGLVLMPAPRIAQQWERAVVLRFGR